LLQENVEYDHKSSIKNLADFKSGDQIEPDERKRTNGHDPKISKNKKKRKFLCSVSSSQEAIFNISSSQKFDLASQRNFILSPFCPHIETLNKIPTLTLLLQKIKRGVSFG